MPVAAEDDLQLYPSCQRLYALVNGPKTPEPLTTKASRL